MYSKTLCHTIVPQTLQSHYRCFSFHCQSLYLSPAPLNRDRICKWFTVQTHLARGGWRQEEMGNYHDGNSDFYIARQRTMIVLGSIFHIDHWLLTCNNVMLSTIPIKLVLFVCLLIDCQSPVQHVCLNYSLFWTVTTPLTHEKVYLTIMTCTTSYIWRKYLNILKSFRKSILMFSFLFNFNKSLDRYSQSVFVCLFMVN